MRDAEPARTESPSAADVGPPGPPKPTAPSPALVETVEKQESPAVSPRRPLSPVVANAPGSPSIRTSVERRAPADLPELEVDGPAPKAAEAPPKDTPGSEPGPGPGPAPASAPAPPSSVEISRTVKIQVKEEPMAPTKPATQVNIEGQLTVARPEVRLEDSPKEKQLARVIFEKREWPADAEGKPPDAGARDSDHSSDYTLPLFVSQTYSPPRAPVLHNLLTAASKTLNTANHFVDLYEQHDCRILKRVYQLQHANRWSLRQSHRSVEPPRPSTHWDALLKQVKWLRTDFREERKWKVTVAHVLACWCAEWVASEPVKRAALQVRPRRPRARRNADGDGAPPSRVPRVHDRMDPSSPINDLQSMQPTPDLISSVEDESTAYGHQDGNRDLDEVETPPPAALFSLGPQDVAFSLRKTSASDRLLLELPSYERERDTAVILPSGSSSGADATWKLAVVPVSKYATGKIMLPDPVRPTETPVLEQEEDLADDDLDDTISPDAVEGRRPREQTARTGVALFNPENKHILDRIHAGHAFRPPSEFPMPPQSFFENRSASQWTAAEEDELRALVKRYAYNWSLIADLLSARSLYSSGAERRTPWECFECWVGLEGLPADMQRTQYFRTYHARLEAAQRGAILHQPLTQQSQQDGSHTTTPIRRRSTQPIKVERRKQTKHLALIDAMRKLAKQREMATQKQQHGEQPILFLFFFRWVAGVGGEEARPSQPYHEVQRVFGIPFSSPDWLC